MYVGAPTADPLDLGGLPGSYRLPDGSCVFTRRGLRNWRRERRAIAFAEAGTAAAWLHQNPADALIVDTRGDAPGPFALGRSGELLARVLPSGGDPPAIGRDRILGIVGAADGASETAYQLGLRGVGGVLVAPDAETVAQRIDRVIDRAPGGGRIAVCLAGGGIEGLFYELGVLRALETFLADRSVVDFDLFCGISAGAVLGAFLANGIGPDEIARGLRGKSARIDPISRAELFDPNFRELRERAGSLARDLIRGGVGPRGMLSSLTRALPSGAFAGDRLRSWLANQLQKPGMSDSFERLRRPLFVGATDQDTAEAVVFGEDGRSHVPVHRAVRASAALVPFYAPEPIDGRWYVDGAFSRTTNMRVAVRQGATLVILVDPLVPVHAIEPGYVRRRGGVFATMQGLKALINQRFDKAIDAIREMFPDVAFHLFRPEADEMRILSGSPMKVFYRPEVEEIAFRRTAEKIRAQLPKLARDFAVHGVTFRDPEACGRSLAGEVAAITRLEPSQLGVGV